MLRQQFTKFVDLHTASYLLSSLPLPAASPPSTLTSYSSRLDLIHAAGIRFSSTSYSSRLYVIHAAGILFSTTSYSSCRIVQLPSVPVRAALTIHEARRPPRRIIFAIVFAAASLTAIFIDIVLIVSCLIRQTAFVSVT